MDELTTGYGASSAADGLRAFAAHYEAQRFVGRVAELAALDAWLEGDDQTMLVVAPAGKGKSALLWAWVKTVPNVVWVPISVRFDTARSETVRALLSTKLNAMGAATSGDWIDIAHRLAPIVVVLDGLDECTDEALVDDLRELPSGVRVVVAARELIDRDANEWAATLGWTGSTLELAGLERAAVSELVGEVEAGALNEIVGLADGDPLTATLLADAARNDEGFERWWESDAFDTQLLTALARALGPAPPNMLAAMLAREPDEVMSALHDARRFIVTNAAGAVSFAHPRLGHVFEDRLPTVEVAAIDRRWRDAVEELAGKFDDLAPAARAYVLQGRMTHQVRCGGTAQELAGVISLKWLRAWEAFEGGKTGFLSDVDLAWGAIERELEHGWSDALCVEQNRLCAIRTALSSIERGVSPATRAAAVRCGVRSQRAAVASVAAIDGGYPRNHAIKALLGELDDHGFDLLLYVLEPARGTALPVREIAERLLGAGLPDEAQRWILEDPRARRHAIIELIHRFDDPEPFRAALREDLEGLPDLGMEWRAECFATSAAAFDGEERHAWLRRAAELIDQVGDENLFWDSYEGTCDARLTLADALIDAREPDEARRWLDRVWANPVPFSEGANGLSMHAVQVWVKLGEIPEGLLDRAYDVPGAIWTKYVAGMVGEAAATDAIANMGPEGLVSVFGHADEAMCAIAARRAVQLLDAHIADPEEYGPAYAIHKYGARALGMAGPHIPEMERTAVLGRAWVALREPRGPISRWNAWEAVLGLLAATDPVEREDVAREVMQTALSLDVRIGSPALCDVETWWDAFDSGHREYVQHALRPIQLGRSSDWIHELVELGDTDAARAALALARRLGNDEDLARVSKVSELWSEIAEDAITRFEADDFGAWPLARIVANAPTAVQAEQLASRAWDARFEDIGSTGCAGEMLAALPDDRAREIAARLLERKLTRHVTGKQLPPTALSAWIDAQLEAAENPMQRAYAYLNFVDARYAGAQVEALRTSVLDEAIATLGSEDEELEVLETLVAHLDAERAAVAAEALYERGSGWVGSALSHRLAELGMGDLVRDDVELSPMDTLRKRLSAASNLEDITVALTGEARAASYGWVAEIIVERGLVEPWARHIATLPRASERLAAWNHIWARLPSSLQAELSETIDQSIDEEREEPITARWGLIEQLDRPRVRHHWLKEMRTLRRSKAPFLPGAYAEPLGLGERFAAGYAEVLRWFIE